jgi:uncharacterized membrane protein (DUF4010 family)
MTAPEAFQALGISLGLGLLVGLQRERAGSRVAGFRTFTLITLLGTLAGLLAETLGGWVVVAGLLGVVAMLTVANVIRLREGDLAPGMTTEVAAQVMYCVGAYVVFGHRSVALAVGGAVAVMLYAKPALHGISARMGEGEMRGVIQFALVALVILPILPDEPYGPFKVLNPRQIWWMVVLVSGISLSGYIAFRLLGQGKAAVVSGLLGGLISSTATTVSYARRAAEDARRVPAATLVIMLASAVVYARVLLEVSLVARPVLPSVAGPIAVMLGAALLQSAFVWLRARRAEAEISPDNPTELRAAVSFGVLFALVLLAVAAAKEYFGDRGLYAVAAISGLTDMDAITLSTSRMSAEGALAPATAWRAIVVAAIANLVFKGGIVAVLGGRRLFARVALLFGFNVLVGALLLVLWPG